MVKKTFALGALNQTRDRVRSANPQEQIIDLERVDLHDKGNWLRALEDCKPASVLPLDLLLEQITAYQGQIDRALQTAQAQSTIYAYAIGQRLDLIEENQLFAERGYRNLTEFINAGEIKRRGGESITSRQIWSYRRVTRGLDDFFALIEQLRRGDTPSEVREEIERLGLQIRQDIVGTFLTSYVDGIASVLELGVSKLEQLCRLPQPIAWAGLLSGQVSIQETLVPVHDVSFAELRRAVSQFSTDSKAEASGNFLAPTELPLDRRFANTYKRMKAAKIWADPQKVKQLEKLLKQLDKLMETDELPE
jgi:hypothetical protein